MLNLEDFLGRKEFKRKFPIENSACKMDLINRLPNELWSKILQYLNFNDYVRLSQVNKRWNSIVQMKTNKFNELAIFLNQTPNSERMYFNNKVINYSNTVSLPSLYCLFLEEFKEKFKSIKYLIIVNNFDDDLQPTKIDFNDNIFSYFTELRHIELRNIQQIRGCLKLPILESFYGSTTLESNFIINSENLTHLAFFGRAKPSPTYTNKLETIAANSLTSPFIGFGFLNNDCANFRNLIASSPTEIKWIMNKFQKRLKQVQCINQLKVHEIRNLVKEADDLRLNDLELLYFDINIRSEEFRHLLKNLNDETMFFVENLDEQFLRIFSESFPINFLDTLHFVKEIVLDNNNLNLSDEFISKLQNLETLTIQSTNENEEKLDTKVLTKFMKNSTKLKRLNLESVVIFQEHMNALPFTFKLLNELKIKDCIIDNLDFVNQLKYLQTFTTNCDLNVKQTTKLLLECCPVKIIFC